MTYQDGMLQSVDNKRGGLTVRTHVLLRVGASFWVSSLVAQFFLISTYSELLAFRSSQLPQLLQACGLGSFLLCVFLSQPRAFLTGGEKGAISLISMLWIFLGLLLSVSAMWSIKPVTSLLYTGVLCGALYASRIFVKQSPDTMARTLGFLALTCVGLLFAMLIVNGFNGRTIGWVPPNNIGKIAFCSLVFSMMSNFRLRTILSIASVGFIILVSSRGMLIAALCFIFVYAVVHGGYGRRILLWSWAAITGLGVLSMLQGILNVPITIAVAVNKVFAITDADRGLGSGFTGRVEYWNNALQLLLERPIAGYGFRTRGSLDDFDSVFANAHSGWLNMILDIGIIGTTILVLIVLLSCFTGLKMARYGAAQKHAHYAQNGAAIAAYFLVLPLFWALEPNYLNFGMVDIVVFLLLSMIAAGGIKTPSTTRS